jgi:hypothetical protein
VRAGGKWDKGKQPKHNVLHSRQLALSRSRNCTSLMTRKFDGVLKTITKEIQVQNK